MRTPVRLLFPVAALVIALTHPGSAHGQCVSLTTLGSASTQNFDTLSNTAGSTTNNLTITGWFLTESGGGARDNEQYAVDTGGSNTGDTYSYGAAAGDRPRARRLRSGTLIPIFGVLLHQQHRRDDQQPGRRLHRRGVATRNGSPHGPDQLRVQHQCDRVSSPAPGRSRSAQLRHPRHGHGWRQERQMPPTARTALCIDDLCAVHCQRRDLLDPLDRYRRHRRRRRPLGRRFLAHPARRGCPRDAVAVDQRRLAERRQRRHHDASSSR